MKDTSPHIIGQEPNIFIPPIYPSRPLGGYGQHTIQHFQLDHIGDHRNNDRLGWNAKFKDSLILDWYSPDEENPFVGPSNWAIVGTPLLNQKTPWNLFSNESMKSTYFDGTESYSKVTTGFGITSDDDVFIAMQIFMDPVYLTNAVSYQFFELSVIGVQSIALIKHSSGPNQIWGRIQGTSTTVYPIVNVSLGWTSIILAIRRGGLSILYADDNKGTAGTPAGSLFQTDSCAIAKASGYSAYKGHISRIIVAKGVDLLSGWSDENAAEIINSMNGIHNQMGTIGSLQRNSSATNRNDSKYFMMSLDSPCSGDENGLLIEPSVTNKVYKNFNPSATTGLTATGGMTLATVANDNSALSSANIDLLDFGPSVFRVQNTTGSTQYVYATPQTGNTNKHSLSVFARYISGSNANLGFYDQVGTSFSQGVAISDDYTRTENPNLTPLSTDSWALEIPNNTEIYFILHQMEEFWTCTSPIPNNLSGSTVSRSLHDFNTGYEINDISGKMQFKIKTVFTGPVGITSYIWGSAIVYFLNGNNYLRTYDGINQAVVTSVNVCDGNWHDVEISWNANIGTHTLTVDNISDTAPYDGSWGISGAIHLGSISATSPVHIKNIRFLRN